MKPQRPKPYEPISSARDGYQRHIRDFVCGGLGTDPRIADRRRFVASTSRAYKVLTVGGSSTKVAARWGKVML
jgi:hypothetical protein